MRNTSIEALRFVFICIICLWHCRDFAPWLNHGYIAVEFYFILSGYFIHQSFLRHPDIGVFEFTWKKVKRFFAPFCISVFLLMLLDRKQYFYLSEFTADGILSTYYKHIHEFFFCQGMGLTGVPGINHPLWYISVLIFGGSLLYSILRNFPKKSTSLFFPAICIFVFPFILSNGSCSLQNYGIIFGLQVWMLRGIAEMALGIMLSVFILHCNKFIQEQKIIVSLFSILGLLGMLLMCTATGNYDYLALFLVPLIILGCICKGGVLNKLFCHRIWVSLGNLSLYMYFSHLFVASVYWISCGWFPLKEISSLLMIPLYLLGVVIAAYCLKKVSNSIRYCRF